jgi:hypothetical protein
VTLALPKPIIVSPPLAKAESVKAVIPPKKIVKVMAPTSPSIIFTMDHAKSKKMTDECEGSFFIKDVSDEGDKYAVSKAIMPDPDNTPLMKTPEPIIEEEKQPVVKTEESEPIIVELPMVSSPIEIDSGLQSEQVLKVPIIDKQVEEPLNPNIWWIMKLILLREGSKDEDAEVNIICRKYITEDHIREMTKIRNSCGMEGVEDLDLIKLSKRPEFSKILRSLKKIMLSKVKAESNIGIASNLLTKNVHADEQSCMKILATYVYNNLAVAAEVKAKFITIFDSVATPDANGKKLLPNDFSIIFKGQVPKTYGKLFRHFKFSHVFPRGDVPGSTDFIINPMLKYDKAFHVETSLFIDHYTLCLSSGLPYSNMIKKFKTAYEKKGRAEEGLLMLEDNEDLPLVCQLIEDKRLNIEYYIYTMLKHPITACFINKGAMEALVDYIDPKSGAILKKLVDRIGYDIVC